jgi:hypothetical protein
MCGLVTYFEMIQTSLLDKIWSLVTTLMPLPHELAEGFKMKRASGSSFYRSAIKVL